MPGKKMTLVQRLEAATWMRDHADDVAAMTPEVLADKLFDACSFTADKRPTPAVAARIREEIGIKAVRTVSARAVRRAGDNWKSIIDARLERIERHLDLPEIYPAVPSETQE